MDVLAGQTGCSFPTPALTLTPDLKPEAVTWIRKKFHRHRGPTVNDELPRPWSYWQAELTYRNTHPVSVVKKSVTGSTVLQMDRQNLSHWRQMGEPWSSSWSWWGRSWPPLPFFCRNQGLCQSSWHWFLPLKAGLYLWVDLQWTWTWA